ncbi:Wzz/FepE/Etk N-terminal domain-containing protein [Falsiroseomonas sp. CW058]|uniref:Wzz/FepE/Etk N-terminal domain-containing protein n=1 Tax=Falsiroseomonas sp. CW058 TaxID=3388664 RepID=UPI003D314B4F
MAIEDLLAQLWRRRWRVALLTLLFLGGGGGAILALPRSYVAEAVVAPSETTGIATSALLSGALPPGNVVDARPAGNFAIYLGALRSAEAVAMLAASTPLVAQIAERRAAPPLGDLRRALGLRMEADADDLRDWLERNLGVTQTTGAVTWTLTLAHRDRDGALDALSRLHAFAEAKVRADLAQMARRRVAALEERLSREPDVYIRQSLYELLAQQQRAGVVVAADEAVAARLVQAPMVERRPSLPNRPLLLLLLVVAAPVAAAALVAAAVLFRAPAARRPLAAPGPAE